MPYLYSIGNLFCCSLHPTELNTWDAQKCTAALVMGDEEMDGAKVLTPHMRPEFYTGVLKYVH